MTESVPREADVEGPPDIRKMPVPEAIAWLAEHGEPADPRPDIDTASLIRRYPRLASVVTEDRTLAGALGPIRVRAYRDPSAPSTGRGLVWVHGGAFIGGHLDMPESNWVARELAARGTPVLAVDYSKCVGGVHYPTPSDDVLIAWRFAVAESEDLLGVHGSDLLLGGASAGGALTAGATQRLLDAGEGAPAGLVLVYPVLHANGPDASSTIDSAAPSGQLSLNYAGSDEALLDPQVFAGMGDGSGFPPTLIVTCENDGLRPSGEAFAVTLERAGTEVVLYDEPNAGHGHIDQPGDEGALRTIQTIAHWMTAG